MNYLKIFSKNEKNKIVNKLNKQFGVESVDGIFLMRGSERIFLYLGNLNERQIRELERTIVIERLGIYFGKEVGEEFRLSIEGVQILQSQINKNIFELNKEQADLWMSGSELNIETGFHGFLIMKYGNDFLGCGKASALKIGNFIPKNRRLKLKG